MKKRQFRALFSSMSILMKSAASLVFLLVLISSLASAEKRSAYETLAGKPKPNTLEEAHAWRLYNQYKASQTAQANALQGLRATDRDRQAVTYGFGAPFAVDPGDAAAIANFRNIANTERERQRQLEAAWDRRFSGYYGPLTDSSQTIETSFNDPHDPLKTHRKVMDKIEYRLRSFPYSERGKGPAVSQGQQTEREKKDTGGVDSKTTKTSPGAIRTDKTDDKRIEKVEKVEGKGAEKIDEEKKKEKIQQGRSDQEKEKRDTPVRSTSEPRPNKENQKQNEKDKETREARAARDRLREKIRQSKEEDPAKKGWKSMTSKERRDALTANKDVAWEKVKEALEGDKQSAKDVIEAIDSKKGGVSGDAYDPRRDANFEPKDIGGGAFDVAQAERFSKEFQQRQGGGPKSTAAQSPQNVMKQPESYTTDPGTKPDAPGGTAQAPYSPYPSGYPSDSGQSNVRIPWEGLAGAAAGSATARGGGNPFQGQMSGYWTGECDGVSGKGSFSLSIKANGDVKGSYRGDQSGELWGRVTQGGSLTAAGSGSDGVSWRGQLKDAGGGTPSGNGSWKKTSGKCSGSGAWQSN